MEIARSHTNGREVRRRSLGVILIKAGRVGRIIAFSDVEPRPSPCT